MALPEKTKIWSLIKASLPAINKSGSNGVEMLVWAQDKSLEEVKKRLKEITRLVEEGEEIKSTTIEESSKNT